MWKLLLERWQDIESHARDILRAQSWIDFADLPTLAMRIAVLLVVLAPAVLLWVRLRRPRAIAVDAAGLAYLTRGPRMLGYAAALLLVAGLGAWSAMAPLASAAIAPGVVSPDGHRKTIQHLEGGIIRAILVREGDSVVAGQALVTLDDIQARAKLEEVRERYTHVLAVKARLTAEAVGASEIDFPPELVALGSSNAEQGMLSQRVLLDSRRATLQGKERILNQREKQLAEEIAGLRQVIAAEDEQLKLLGQEIKGSEELYARGLELLPHLLALKRARAQLGGEQAENQAKIARDGQEIGETEMQLLTMHQQEKEQVDEELTKVGAELAELRSQLPSRQDVLSRTAILAPISGIVMNMRVTTTTGVIRPGDPILDIVPARAKLIIDAQIKPT